ncbi:MAG: pirin family protein [Candidatus Kariarchaeaceae archaeon]
MTDKITQRTVKAVSKSVPAIDGAGVRLKRAFGNLQGVNLDPFLLLDDMHSEDPKDFSAGFPWHPHRGIETVTYMLSGQAQHEDSLGNKGTIRSGEIQWMTAGSGIIHQEMPLQKNGLLRGFQLWVNLPPSNKMMQPRYQDIKQHEISEISIDNDIKAKVLAGNFNGISGPVKDIISEPTYLDVTIEAETTFTYSVENHHTVVAYVLDGDAYFDHDKSSRLDKDNLVVFNEGDQLNISTTDNHSRFLLMSGEPIGEPVAWHGPIVMNTREELIHAFKEMNNGTFIKHDYKV